MAHPHTVHLPLGALMSPCTVCGTGTSLLPLPHLPHRQLIEKFQRSYKMQAILGGSEEIMADFAVRQALKKAGRTPARL